MKTLLKTYLKTYLKILSSILISLIILSALFSLIGGSYSLYMSNGDFFSTLLFTFIISGFGFIMFGLTGSISWLLLLIPLSKCSMAEFDKHKVSAISSAFIVTTLTGIWSLGNKFFNEPLIMYWVLIFIVPVVVVSLYVYKRLYLQKA